MENEKNDYVTYIPANVRYDKDLTANAKLLYGEIRALCKEKGYCWASNQYFANLYGVSKQSISTWVKSLIKKGYVSSEMIEGGNKEILYRYIRILDDPIKEIFNTPIKENLNTPIKENLKDNNLISFNNSSFNNSINNSLDNTKKNIQKKVEKSAVIDKQGKTAYELEFESLWKIYPRKQGSKKKSKEKYINARKKDGVTYEIVKNGLERYIEYIKFHEIEECYIKHALTWFNNECWTDEYTYKKKTNFNKFNSIMLGEMENPDEFLFEMGVENYDPRGNRKIVSDDQGELSDLLPGY